VVNEYHPVSWHEDALQSVLGTENVYLFAFQISQLLDPNATLLISDSHNETKGGINYSRTFEIVNSLKANGIQHVGMGLHMHLDGLNPLNLAEVIDAMQSYNVETYMTEVDVNLKSIHPETPGRWEMQADNYARSLRACIRSQVCKGYFVWNLGDNRSWLQNPAADAGDWYSPDANPTLFFDDLTPKPAYYALLKVLFEETDSPSAQ